VVRPDLLAAVRHLLGTEQLPETSEPAVSSPSEAP